MKYYLLFVFFCINIYGQNPQLDSKRLDSLENFIRTYHKKDTTRVLTLMTITEQLVRTNPIKAMKYADEALSISESLDWKRGVVSALRQKGVLYEVMSHYDKSIEYQLKSLKVMEGFDAPVTRKKLFEAGVYINIGNIYNYIKEDDRALVYQKKAEKILSEYKDENIEAVLALNMGLSYLHKKQYPVSEKYLDKSYHLAKKLNYINIYPIYFQNKGQALTFQRKFTEALSFYQQALPFCDKLQDFVTKQAILSGIGETYFYMDDFPKAEKYLEESMSLTEELKIPLERQDSESYHLLSDIYAKTGKYEKALEAYKKYVEINEKVINADKKSDMARKEMQYEADKKEAIAKAEIGKQKVIRNAILIAGSIALISGVFLFLGFRKRQKIKSEQQELLLKAEISETELKALRAQMNPHFIFNALNSIADYINKNDARSADYYLGKFAKLMRGILENSEEKEISLSEELKMLEFYMDLESLRFKNKFNYEVKIADDINPENTLIPPMILQPFVENSILHGLAKKENDGKITIHIDKTEDLLKCTIEDNGIGRKNPNENLNKSYGVKLTRERIALFDKSKNSDSGVFYTDLETGTRVELRLPLEEI